MTGIEICNSCCELVPQPKMIFYNGREPLKLSYADVQPSLAISKKIIENSRVCKNEYGFELEYVSTEKFIQSNRNLFPAEFDTEEGYMLEVGGGKVVIGSSTEKGRYYAVQTLAQLIGLNKNGSITGMTIADWSSMKI